MLGKLLKYEFKATGRTLLPLYGTVIAFAIINRIFMGSSSEFIHTNGFLIFLQALMLIGYVLIIAAASIGTFIIIIQRFYKNLLKDEGYLMNTLPVSTSTNIWGKLIVAVVWNIICVLVILFSILILLSTADIRSAIGGGYEKIVFGLQRSGFYVNANISIIILELIVLSILGSAKSIMMFYASMAIGHLSNKRKVLSSFGAFIGLNIIINMVSGIISIILGENGAFAFNSLADIHWISLYGGISSIIITVILFIISNKILGDKLNLE